MRPCGKQIPQGRILYEPVPVCGDGSFPGRIWNPPLHRGTVPASTRKVRVAVVEQCLPLQPHQKTAARSGIVPGRAAVILILLHQPTHQLCIGNGVLNGQTGDQQGLVIEQLGVLGDLVGVARGVGSLQGGKDRVVRVQL